MMHSLHRQRGISTGGLIIMLGILGFCLWIFFTLFSPYSEYLQVSAAFENLKAQPNASQMNKGAIQKSILTRLNLVDGVKVINTGNFDEKVKVTRNSEGTIVKVNHDWIVPLVNPSLYFLIRLDKEIKL